MADADSTLGMFQRKCPTCSKVFQIGTGRGQARRYCSKECRPPKARPTKRCTIEGCEKTARSQASPYCEMHYYRIRRNGTIAPKGVVGKWACCQHCGAPTERGRKYCDSRCASRGARGTPTVRECATCGVQFDPRSDHGRDRYTCSDSCAKKRDKEALRRFYRTEAGAEWARRNGYRRRARKRNAFVESVSRDEVMRRGRWECHLCGEKIPKSAKWPDPMFGTVDHVLPLAKGGAHSYANCKPAHLKCNLIKGAKLLEQLALDWAAS